MGALRLLRRAVQHNEASQVRRGPVQSPVNKQTPTQADPPTGKGQMSARPESTRVPDDCEQTFCGTIHFLSVFRNRLDEGVQLKSIYSNTAREG